MSMTGAEFREKYLWSMSEKQWQTELVTAAKDLGWKVSHAWTSINSAAGFPDLVLVRDRLIFAELKTMRGKVTTAQREWLWALQKAGGECYIWRPSDFTKALEILL